VWTRKRYSGAARFFGVRLFSSVFPKLIVMVCRKGAFALMMNPDALPDLQGLERHRASSPLITWTPEVMES
jgi:hypothetical protein